jgi:hypothetical protein
VAPPLWGRRGVLSAGEEKERSVFTLNMYYYDESLRDGRGSETIRSQNIPQLGQGIDSDTYYRGTWVVTEVHQAIRDGVLSDTASITLRQKD